MSTPTSGSWTAAAVTAALGICQAGWAISGDHTSLSSALVLAPLSLLAAAGLARVNCLEARLAVVLVVAAPLLMTALALTVGLPGQPRHVVDLTSLVALTAPIVVLVAIDVDRRLRARLASAAHDTDVEATIRGWAP